MTTKPKHPITRRTVLKSFSVANLGLKPVLRLLGLVSMTGAGLLSPAWAAWNDPYSFPATRDPLQWPFATNSIWNMPIGSNAKYTPAGIYLPSSSAPPLGIDEDIIILTPTAPMVQVWETSAGWTGSNRCSTLTGKIFYSVPIPDSFSTDPGYLDTNPNQSAAVLMPDGSSLRQGQPFHRCGVGGKAVTGPTNYFPFPDQDIYGNGILGAHGGTELSSLGGTIRVGELVPGAPPIHHALKLDLWMNQPASCKKVWPAQWCDGSPINGGPYLEGALLALPPTFNITNAGFETEPAKYLARAFQDYGGYNVDNSAWAVYDICTEWGPNGRVKDEFRQNWGFDISGGSTNSPWGRDMMRIFLNLCVVTNNSSSNIGGGGTPRAPLAPAFNTNSAPPVPVSIANPALPADLTVVEGNPAVFNVSLSGSAPFYYQWFHGSTLVGTNAGYTNLFVLPADGGSYFAIVSNSVNSVTSRTATLTVTLDTTAPTVTSVWGSPNQVVLTFNKALDPTTAAQASRYSINDLSVLTATLNPTNAAQVTLTTSTQRLGKLYMVTVNGVKDLLGNPAVNSVGSFRPTITMDGSFGDWAGVAPINWYSPLPSHDTTATDFKDIYVWDDADFIYFRATTWETTTWQEGHTQMFIDTDNNEYTGYIYWHGSEMETDAGVGLQQKNGSWSEGPLDGLNWLCIPSGTGTNFEFRISKHATYHSDGKPIFTTNVINFVFASYNSSWNVVNVAPTPNDYATPNDGGYFTYYFFNPGTLNIAYDPNSGQATVTWDSVIGTLQSCSSLTGTWTDVSGATSPYVFTPTAGGTQYFRLSQ